MSIVISTSKGQAIIPIPFSADITELKNLLPKPKKKVSLEDMNKAITKRKKYKTIPK